MKRERDSLWDEHETINIEWVVALGRIGGEFYEMKLREE